jgi:hypothetical protein
MVIMDLRGLIIWLKLVGERYEQMLSTWKGKDINDLIYRRGPPTSTFTMPNGNKMFTYANIKVGPTITSGASFAHATQSPILGGAFGSEFKNSASVTPEWDCYTTIIANSTGTITSWQIKGNNCIMGVSEDELKKKSVDLRMICSKLQKGDHININYYRRDDGKEMDGPKDVYFMRYNKSMDSISVSGSKGTIRVLGEETCHLEYIEDISFVQGKE